MALAAVLLPAAAAALTVPRAAATVYPEPGPRASGSEVRPEREPLVAERPTVAVVLGEEGANAADTLAPFEVFARTGAFNVVMVAPTSDPVPLTGGLDVLPDLTFEELDRALSGPADVIVLPQLHGSTDAVVRWLEQHRGDAPLVMSVCVGAGVAADAGFFEGRPATSHWLGLIGLRRSHPEVGWVEGRRFVDTGEVISTAGVLSGIDGSLRVVERLAGAGAARRVARELHWSGYEPGGSVALAAAAPRPPDLVALLSAGYRWDRPTTGVLLTDGVGEIELASAFRPYTELSFLSTQLAVTSDGAPVRSRHGLTFVPRSTWAAAVDDVDRVVVPGAAAAASRAADGLPAPGGAAHDRAPETAYLHEDGTAFAFDGALRDIASTYDAATATWVAKSLQYPLPSLPGGTWRWPWWLTLRVALLAAAGGLLAWLALRARSPSRPPGTGSRDSATARPRSARGTTAAASRPSRGRTVP